MTHMPLAYTYFQSRDDKMKMYWRRHWSVCSKTLNMAIFALKVIVMNKFNIAKPAV